MSATPASQQPGPRPVSSLDVDLKRTLTGFHRLRWAMVTAITVLMIFSIGKLGFLLVQAEARQRASCDFYRTIATAPLTPAPGQHAPSKLGTQILISSREAFLGQSCGQIPPPSPSLVHWASFYHLRIPG